MEKKFELDVGPLDNLVGDFDPVISEAKLEVLMKVEFQLLRRSTLSPSPLSNVIESLFESFQ